MSYDVIDLTDLQKRGLLKVRKEEPEQDAPEFMDLSSNNSSASQENDFLGFNPTTSQEQNSSSENASPLGFLDTFAQSSSNNPPQANSSSDNSELAIKLENLEYQLERLTEKLGHIESKVLAFEEKVSN